MRAAGQEFFRQAGNAIARRRMKGANTNQNDQVPPPDQVRRPTSKIQNAMRLNLYCRLTALWLSAVAFTASAQNVAINETGALAHPSAILDLQSNNKGLLTPRLTAFQRLAIAGPAQGLMVYQTDGDAGFYYFDGLAWNKMGSGDGHWAANAFGIHKATEGYVGIGTNAPQALLHLRTQGFLSNALLLDGSEEGNIAQEFRTYYAGPTLRRGFRLVAGEFPDQKPFFELNRTLFNWDFIATQSLVRFYADSTLVAQFGGHIQAQNGFFEDKVRVEGANPGLGLRIPHSPHSYSQYHLDASAAGGVNLWRQDYSENPEAGTAISSASPIVRFGDDNALTTYGDVTVNGEVNVNGGSANMLPIAYATISNNGTVHAQSGGISCAWNAAQRRYEITLSGYSYYYLNYITVATPVTGGNRVTTSSVGGKLLVTLYDNSNNAVAGTFHFITYKP